METNTATVNATTTAKTMIATFNAATTDKQTEYLTWFAKLKEDVHNDPCKLTQKQRNKVCAPFTFEEIQRIAGNPLYKNK